MATEDITLRVRIDELEKELARIPGVTEKQMKKMLGVVSSTYREEEKAAKKAADEQIKQAERVAREAAQAAEKQLSALERVSDKFTGGLAGDMKDLAEAGLGPLSSAGTLAAIGVGAAVAAVVALGTAAVATAVGVVAITRAADEAIRSLDELGMTELISPESRQAVDDANLALDALGVVIDQLTIALAADFAPTVLWAAQELVGLGLSALKTIEDFTKTGDVIESFVLFLATGFVKGLAAPITGLVKLGEVISWVAGMVGGSTPTIDAAVAKFNEYADSAAKSITGLDGLDDAVSSGAQSFTDFGAVMARLRDARAKDAEAAKAQKEATDAANKATKDAAQAAREAAKEQRENAEALRRVEAASDAVANATETLNGIRDQSMDRFLTDQERLTKNYNDEIARIDATIEKVAEHSLTLDQVAQIEAAASEARLAATSEYLAKLDEIGAKQGEQAVAQAEAVAVVDESWAEFWDRQSEEGGEWFDERIKAIAAVAGAAQDLGAYFEDLHRKQLDATMTEREAEIERIKTLKGEERAAAVEKLKQLTAQANEQRKQVNKAFQAQKAAQIAMALIDGARSALSLIPAFAFLGPAAPAAAAGVAAAATAVQIAQIAAQKPKFHTGLDPSETPAIITRGEGIANQRAMTSPMFREQLRAANAGEQAESGHGTVIMLNDRVLATLDRRTARVTGRLQSGGRVARVGTSTHYDR